jgi:hypothetical protein
MRDPKLRSDISVSLKRHYIMNPLLLPVERYQRP